MCRPASDAASLSNHRTALGSDKSSKEYSSCSDYSDNKDNFAVAISTSPRKQAKREELPSKKKLTIAMSESNEDTNNNMASVKLGKLATSYAATPSVGKKSCCTKDAKRNPLNLSGSNWLVKPVDASPAYFFSDSSSLNGLSVVNQIDNYPLSRDAPGNALKKIEEPTKIIG